MKLLFIFSNYHLSHITAQPGIALKLAHKAVDKGHKVTILANTDKELLTNDGKIKLILFKGLGDLQTYIKNFWIITKTMITEKPDVIHIHGHLLFIMISFLNIFFRISISFFSSETIDILTPWQKKLFIVALNLSRKIFVTSEFIKKEFIHEGIDKNKIVVIHIGIDDRFYKQPLKLTEEIDVLFFGDSFIERGFDRVVELVNALPKIKFQILLRWNDQKQLDKIKNRKNVNVLHYPYKDPLDHFIAKSKIILLPFRFMGVRPPVSILEGMISEKCVVTSTMDGNNEVIKDNEDGILDEFSDITKTAVRINELLINKEKRGKIAENARKTMLKLYSADEYRKIITQLESL